MFYCSRFINNIFLLLLFTLNVIALYCQILRKKLFDDFCLAMAPFTRGTSFSKFRIPQKTQEIEFLQVLLLSTLPGNEPECALEFLKSLCYVLGLLSTMFSVCSCFPVSNLDIIRIPSFIQIHATLKSFVECF